MRGKREKEENATIDRAFESIVAMRRSLDQFFKDRSSGTSINGNQQEEIVEKIDLIVSFLHTKVLKEPESIKEILPCLNELVSFSFPIEKTISVSLFVQITELILFRLVLQRVGEIKLSLPLSTETQDLCFRWAINRDNDRKEEIVLDIWTLAVDYGRLFLQLTQSEGGGFNGSVLVEIVALCVDAVSLFLQEDTKEVLLWSGSSLIHQFWKSFMNATTISSRHALRSALLMFLQSAPPFAHVAKSIGLLFLVGSIEDDMSIKAKEESNQHAIDFFRFCLINHHQELESNVNEPKILELYALGGCTVYVLEVPYLQLLLQEESLVNHYQQFLLCHQVILFPLKYLQQNHYKLSPPLYPDRTSHLLELIIRSRRYSTNENTQQKLRNSKKSIGIIQYSVADLLNILRYRGPAGGVSLYKDIVNSLHEEWKEEDRFTPGFLKTIQVSGSEKQKLSPERIQLIRKYLEQVYQMVGSLLLVQYEQYHRDHHIDGGGQNVVQDNETTSRIVLDCQMFTLMMQLEFAKSFATCSLKRSQELVGLLFQQMEILLERQPQVFIQHVLQDPLGYNNHHQLATKKNIEFQDDFLIGIGLLELDRMIQRRLRTILHHPTAATELFEASLGVIFLGVFHSYKPLDSFVHRFLSFCINNLPRLMVAFPTLKGKINNQRILPYYMELLLINYPTRVSKETVPRVLSVILGALFYNTSSSHTSLQVWVMKRLGQRAIELLKLPKRLDLEMLVAKKKEQEEVEQTNGNIETSKKSAKAINTVNEDGLFLLTLVFEILKIVPLDHGDHLLVASAKEVERMIHLLREWTTNENKSELFKIVCDRLYSMISTNCDADRRAWLASWYLDLVNIYDLSISSKHKNSHMSKL